MTVSDAEKAYYESILADPEGKSLADLRYAYFLAALDGGLPTSPVAVPEGLEATGTPSANNYLRGDGTWATPATAMTAAQAAAGTETTSRLISPKVLADEILRRLPAAPTTGTYHLISTDGVLSWAAVV